MKYWVTPYLTPPPCDLSLGQWFLLRYFKMSSSLLFHDFELCLQTETPEKRRQYEVQLGREAIYWNRGGLDHLQGIYEEDWTISNICVHTAYYEACTVPSPSSIWGGLDHLQAMYEDDWTIFKVIWGEQDHPQGTVYVRRTGPSQRHIWVDWTLLQDGIWEGLDRRYGYVLDFAICEVHLRRYVWGGLDRLQGIWRGLENIQGLMRSRTISKVHKVYREWDHFQDACTYGRTENTYSIQTKMAGHLQST